MLSRIEEHIRDAKLFREGNLAINKNLENLNISDGIDWNYKHVNSSKTYQVYLHSLGIIKSLVMTAQRLKDDEYLGEAKNLILKWSSKPHKSELTQAWHEHAVSSRLNNVIFFQERAGEYKLDSNFYQEFLLKHCDFLSSKKNYMENNHGIMMDNSLISAAQRISDKTLKSRYMEIAYYRVKMAFLRDFSKMGAHLENSPEYHKMVLNMIKNVSTNLNKNGYSLGKNFPAFMTRAVTYSKAVIKPNKELPIIGDSSQYDETLEKSYGDFIDHEAGILISQFRNKINESQSTWMFFKSGYSSLTHKHKDDLSIYLYMNGHDLLMDSGKYSYNLKDPIRKYIVSPQAHSTVYLRNSDYSFTNAYRDQIKLKTTRHVNRVSYKVSAGINNLYKDTNISRYTVLTSDNLLVVYDKIISKTEQEAVQNFVLPEYAQVNRLNEHTYEVAINEKSYIFKNHIIDDVEISSEIKDGHLSYKFNKSVENKRIEFTKKNRRIDMVTTIHEKVEGLELSDMKADRIKISFNKNGEATEFIL